MNLTQQPLESSGTQRRLRDHGNLSGFTVIRAKHSFALHLMTSVVGRDTEFVPSKPPPRIKQQKREECEQQTCPFQLRIPCGVNEVVHTRQGVSTPRVPTLVQHCGSGGLGHQNLRCSPVFYRDYPTQAPDHTGPRRHFFNTNFFHPHFFTFFSLWKTKTSG